MEIEYNLNKDVLLAKLKGELDEYSASYVRVSLDSLLNDLSCVETAKVVFDFSEVTFMDSTGIGVLLGRYNKFKRKINMNIKNPCEYVDRILKMTGIYEIMPKI